MKCLGLMFEQFKLCNPWCVIWSFFHTIFKLNLKCGTNCRAMGAENTTLRWVWWEMKFSKNKHRNNCSWCVCLCWVELCLRVCVCVYGEELFSAAESKAFDIFPSGRILATSSSHWRGTRGERRPLSLALVNRLSWFQIGSCHAFTGFLSDTGTSRSPTILRSLHTSDQVIGGPAACTEYVIWLEEGVWCEGIHREFGHRVPLWLLLGKETGR